MPEPFISCQDMQRVFTGGPDIAKAVLVMLGGRMYKRESDGWYLLDAAHANPSGRDADGPT